MACMSCLDFTNPQLKAVWNSYGEKGISEKERVSERYVDHERKDECVYSRVAIDSYCQKLTDRERKRE
jgi:hypothetical protein